MNQIFTISFIIVVSSITCCICAGSNGKQDTDWINSPMKCRGKPLKISEEDKGSIKECIKKFTPDGSDEPSDLPPEKKNCVVKCMMMNDKLLDEQEQPKKEYLMKMIRTKMPEEFALDLIKPLEKCMDENKNISIDPNDDNCGSYQQLIECFKTSFIEFCNASPY